MLKVTSPATRFTFAEYQKMADAGLFGDRRVELINGRIYRFSPQHDPHMLAVSNALDAIFPLRLKSDWVIAQGTFQVDKYSAPEPDILWLPAPKGTPSAQWPSPVLVIEVSNTTYKRDSGVKLRKYAEHAITDYWIVNIPAKRVEVYRDPQNPTGKPAGCRYDSIQHFSPGQSITLLNRQAISLAVNDLLP